MCRGVQPSLFVVFALAPFVKSNFIMLLLRFIVAQSKGVIPMSPLALISAPRANNNFTISRLSRSDATSRGLVPRLSFASTSALLVNKSSTTAILPFSTATNNGVLPKSFLLILAAPGLSPHHRCRWLHGTLCLCCNRQNQSRPARLAGLWQASGSSVAVHFYRHQHHLICIIHVEKLVERFPFNISAIIPLLEIDKRGLSISDCRSRIADLECGDTRPSREAGRGHVRTPNFQLARIDLRRARKFSSIVNRKS